MGLLNFDGKRGIFFVPLLTKWGVHVMVKCIFLQDKRRWIGFLEWVLIECMNIFGYTWRKIQSWHFGFLRVIAIENESFLGLEWLSVKWKVWGRYEKGFNFCAVWFGMDLNKTHVILARVKERFCWRPAVRCKSESRSSRETNAWNKKVVKWERERERLLL